MAQALVVVVVFEGMRAVTRSIVGEDGVRLDTVLMEVGHRADGRSRWHAEKRLWRISETFARNWTCSYSLFHLAPSTSLHVSNFRLGPTFPVAHFAGGVIYLSKRVLILD